VLEAQPKPGGAVQTAEITLPGFRHDLYATNLNAFAVSPFFAQFQHALARHGLRLLRATNAFCSLFPDGDLLGVTNDIQETVRELYRVSQRDAEVWRRLYDRFLRVGVHIQQLLTAPMPSWRAAAALARFPIPLAVQSSGSFARRSFENPKVRALWAVWGMHLDFPPDISGGALYPFLACMSAQSRGLHFGDGGAQGMIDALVALLRESGGELHCDLPVSQIVIEQGAATGVMVRGEYIAARRAVIANLSPAVLFGRLAAIGRLAEKARRYRHGPGTMMIHLALSDLPDWLDPRARRFAYIHIAPSLDVISRAYRDAVRGKVPEEPILVVAQPTVVDRSRAPDAKHVLSIQVRALPSVVDKERYADHVIRLLERYAPQLRERILARCVLAPADLEKANSNLIGGDSIGGSHHLDQQFVFRPFLGWSRYRTPIGRLYICGASTWPGAGVGAGSGWLLGTMLTRRWRHEAEFT
jgi:phytoene dehydrogenase-like protein